MPEFKYFRPKSLSWWSGILLIAFGAAQLGFKDNIQFAEISQFLTLMSGGTDASPAMMIFTGLGVIGLRDKLTRG